MCALSAFMGATRKEVQRVGDEQKTDERVQEISVGEYRAVQRERHALEVRLAEHGGDQRREQVFDEGAHHRAERRAHHHCDGQVYHITAQHELFEAFQHGRPSGLVGRVIAGCGCVNRAGARRDAIGAAFATPPAGS